VCRSGYQRMECFTLYLAYYKTHVSDIQLNNPSHRDCCRYGYSVEVAAVCMRLAGNISAISNLTSALQLRQERRILSLYPSYNLNFKAGDMAVGVYNPGNEGCVHYLRSTVHVNFLHTYCDLEYHYLFWFQEQKQLVYTVRILECGSGKNIHTPVRCSSYNRPFSIPFPMGRTTPAVFYKTVDQLDDTCAVRPSVHCRQQHRNYQHEHTYFSTLFQKIVRRCGVVVSKLSDCSSTLTTT
ncbi:hypothetical protein L9F63_021556, partial [Diploptera punctata]